MRTRNTCSVKSIVCAILCMLSAVVIGLLFGFYHARSVHLLVYDSALLPDTSWSARSAASLFYLCGGFGTLFLCGALFVCAYFFAQHRFADAGERLVALFVAGAAWLGISFVRHVDCIQGSIPGGFFGYCVGASVQRLLGVHLLFFGLYLVFTCALIVMVRFAHMPLVHHLVCGVEQIGLWLHKKRAVYHVQKFCIALKNALCALVPLCVRWFLRFTRGTIFERAAMTVPDDHDVQAEKIRALCAALQGEDAREIDLCGADEHAAYDGAPRYASALRDDHEDAVEPARVSEPRAASLVDTHHNTAGDALSTPYHLPDVGMVFHMHDKALDTALTKELQTKAVILQEKLERFGISGTVVAIKRGPVVTLYEYQPSIDTKISKILALEDDLALALQALSIRIIAPIPGREVVGFEVANTHMQPVTVASIFASDVWIKGEQALPLILGVDTIGGSVVVDLASMPHVLIAGSTGSGKSVALNTMLISLLCRRTPDELKLILIDPKRLEFAAYADIAHLLFPIVADPRRAAPVLRWVIKEMEERYECMAHYGVRTIKDYNRIITHGKGGAALPFIVVVIDELSDLMMTTGREVEDAIARIAQMARAAGIHLIIATQRPSVDVITGLIKVNFPSRISFRVTSRIDSRTILDCGGAEKLLGRGDMLFLDSHTALLRRLHGAYISDGDIQKIVVHIRAQRAVEYCDSSVVSDTVDDGFSDGDDILYQQVLSYVTSIDEISISLLQRKFKIGFNRSARIIDYLEKQGRIMPPEGSKPRKVIH